MTQIQAALLAYGVSGKVFHAPFLHAHPGFRLAGAWERIRQRIAQDYPGAYSFGSLEELLGNSEIGLVIVNTPTYTHYDLAKRALEAGKHVVVEKAFTTTVAEAIELEALARQKGLVLSVFQNRRWDSDFSTVRRVVEEGLTGQVHSAELSFLRYRPEIGPKAHVEQPGPGAGILNDLGPHLIDQAYSLFGMPDAVFADLRTLRPASKVDDTFDLQMFYKELRVRLYAGTLVREPQPAYIIHGTTGSFIKGRTDRQEALLKEGARPDTPEWYTEPEADYGVLSTGSGSTARQERLRSSTGSYMGYYNALYRAITGNGEVPVPAADGICVMQIIEAARKSSDSGTIVPVAPLAR